MYKTMLITLDFLEKIEKYILAAITFTVPLFFLPITPNFYGWNKQVLILAAGAISFLLWGLKTLVKGKIEIYYSKQDLIFASLLVVSLLSTFLNLNSVQSLMGRVMLFTGLFLIYFTISQNYRTNPVKENLTSDQLPLYLYTFLASASLLSFISILGFVEILNFLPQGWGRASSWTPAGSQFAFATASLAALVVCTVALIRYVLDEDALEENFTSCLILGIQFPILLAGLTVFTMEFVSANSQAFSLKNPLTQEKLGQSASYIRIPLQASWQIATGVMGKNLKATFIGVGPGNYGQAFSAFKPLKIARSALWPAVFQSASNEPLHILATLGLFGLIIWGLLLYVVGKDILKSLETKKKLGITEIALISVIVSQLLLPPNLLSWFLIFLLTAHLNLLPIKKIELEAPPITIPTAAILTTAALGYLTTRAYAAEIKFYKSIQELRKNNGEKVIELQQQAARLNPKNANYHISLSQTLMSVVKSISANIQNQKKDLSEERKTQLQNQLNNLFQQSIREAQTAVALSGSSVSWRQLGDIYVDLVGSVEGAANSALTAYNRAISKDPLNPTLRLKRGELFLLARKGEEASQNFRAALEINPRLVDGWYGLYRAYKQTGDIQKAKTALQNTMKLVDDPKLKEQIQKVLQNLEETPPSDKEKTVKKEGTTPTPTPEKTTPTTTPVPTEEEENQPLKESTESAEPQVEGTTSADQSKDSSPFSPLTK